MERPYRIMVIEDSRTQAERVRALFANEGWDVVLASSAEAALEELDRAEPDLIVADYYLPGMNGAEFCREIRMNVNTRGIPVLMLTVEGAHEAEARGLESGADDYLAKSVDPDILLLRAGALLRRSPGAAAVVAAGAEKFYRRARLLAVDDSPTWLHYLAQELAAENYSVEKASDGEEALMHAASQPLDCILVDLEMPGMDGIEVCRRLAGIRREGDLSTLILVLTAHEEKENMVRALEAGADDFIGKSVEMPVLKARIRALLRRRFMMEENRRIREELKDRELEAVRARAEQAAAEVRATMADRLARSNLELAEANRKLEEALGVTRAITEHAAEALFLADAAGRLTFLNPAAVRMFGFEAAELIGQNLHEKIHYRRPDGSAYPSSECPVTRSLVTGAGLNGHEDVFFRKDGSPVEVSCSLAPILQDGNVTAAVMVVHDITGRKRAEERMRHTQKLESVGLLAGGIAHDFNNILTSIMGTASLIEEELPPGALGGKLRMIVDSAEKAANLTRQLLAYAGKGRFIVREMDLSAAVRDMSDLLRLSVPRNIDVRLLLDDGLPRVSADPGQIQQIVMNLAINGGEAVGAGESGSVSISTATVDVAEAFIDAAGAEVAPGRYVCLQVSDTGAGMDEATRARVFDPFFTTKFTGRGLGLAAVAGIMRSQKGGITIDTAPGRGSTFRALFPAARAAEPAPPTPNNRPKVLVVDDEDTVRHFLKGALERHGFAVATARNGREAMAALDEYGENVALTVLDLVMPVMGGPDVLEAIKRRFPKAKVLLTSGYSEAEAKRLCAAYADTLFIQKPYSAQTLVQKVRSAIGQKQ